MLVQYLSVKGCWVNEVVCLHCRVNLSDCLLGCVGSRGCGSKGIRSSNGGSSCCLLSSVLSKKYVWWC